MSVSELTLAEKKLAELASFSDITDYIMSLNEEKSSEKSVIDLYHLVI